MHASPLLTCDSDPFARFVIGADSTIRHAMAAISGNAREFVLVQDEARRIIGLITDGDIRRGLLAGLTLDSLAKDVMTRDFFAVSPRADRAFVLDLMKARSFQHIPVIDDERRLTAIHFLRDLIGTYSKQNFAVVMAGGKGSRLRPITETIPKPMVEVAGRPMLERIILHLVGHGIRNIYIALNFMGDVIEKHFGDGAPFGCEIKYLRETRPLGTGGALSLLPFRPQHPVFVLNGDLVMHADLTRMLEFHTEGKYKATMAVGPYQVQIPFGTVVEKAGRLIGLEEKPSANFLVNRGIYVLNPETIEHVPKNQEFPITALFEELLASSQQVGAFYFADSWLDVGAPADLHRARGFA